MGKTKEDREALYAYLESIGVSVDEVKKLKLNDAALRDLAAALRKLLADYGSKRSGSLLVLGCSIGINGLMVSAFVWTSHNLA